MSLFIIAKRENRDVQEFQKGSIKKYICKETKYSFKKIDPTLKYFKNSKPKLAIEVHFCNTSTGVYRAGGARV